MCSYNGDPQHHSLVKQKVCHDVIQPVAARIWYHRLSYYSMTEHVRRQYAGCACVWPRPANGRTAGFSRFQVGRKASSVICTGRGATVWSSTPKPRWWSSAGPRSGAGSSSCSRQSSVVGRQTARSDYRLLPSHYRLPTTASCQLLSQGGCQPATRAPARPGTSASAR